MLHATRVIKAVAKAHSRFKRTALVNEPWQESSYLPGALEDIWRSIFEVAYFSLGEASRLRFTLLVASVCKQWRHLALCMPILWSTVYLKLRGRSAGASRLRCLRLFLARSDLLPLTINIVSVKPPATRMRNSSALHDIAEAIFAHINRLRILSVTAPAVASLQTEVLDRLNSPAPALRSLSVKASSHNPSMTSHEFKDLNLPPQFEAPDLRQLTIEPMSALTLGKLPPVESLSFDCLRALNTSTMLSGFQHVRFLHLNSHLGCTPPNLGSPRMRFDRLELFEHSRFLLSGMTGFLLYITAPRLTRVRSELPEETMWMIPEIKEHSVHFPMLTTLEITAGHVLLPPRLGNLSDTIFWTAQKQDSFRSIRLLGVDPPQMAMLLSKLGGVPTSTQGWDLSYCVFPAVTGVRIIDRNALFKSFILRQIVENRREESALPPWTEEKPVSAFDTLHVHTYVPLGADERLWFEQNLTCFSWSADVGGQTEPNGNVDLFLHGWQGI